MANIGRGQLTLTDMNDVLASINPPVSPTEGALWWNLNDSQLYVYENSAWEISSKYEEYVRSRGQNLVTNGTGLLGNNTNFSGWTFDGSQAFAGAGSFFSSAQDATRFSDELIPVDPSSRYRFSLMAKSSLGVGKYYFGVVSYDIDKLSIQPYHFYGSQYPVTTLAQDLKVGDTQIFLTDSTGFMDNSATPDHRHSIVFWGYKNSFGYEYPVGTYSRLVFSTAWNVGGINRTTHVITLSKPFDVTNPNDPQGVFRAGHQVSPTSSGSAYQYMTAGNVTIPTQWTKYENVITGNGISSNLFPHGASFVKLLFLINRSTSGGQAGDSLWLSSLSFSDVTDSEELGESIIEIEETLGNMANDNVIDYNERQVVKDRLTEIIGYVMGDSTTTLPTTATLDSSAKGGLYSVRKSALNAGLLSTDAKYIAVATKYNDLKTYLEGLTPIDAWDLSTANQATNITVVKATFRDKWLAYYSAVNDLAIATAEKLKKNVDDLEAGGRNYASNGDFAIDFANARWKDSYTGQLKEVVDISSETPPFQFAFHVNNTTNANGGIFYGDMFVGDVANAMVGKDLTIQFWLKYQNIVQGTNTWNDGRFGELVVEGETSTGTKVYSYPNVLGEVVGTNMTWAKHSSTIRISLPASAVKLTKISLKHGIEGAKGEFWTTGIKVETGNMLSDWSADPLDLNGRFTNVESKVTPTAIIDTVTSSETYTQDLATIEAKVAKLLTLSASSHVMTFNASDVATPSSQVINIDANVQNLTGTATFSAIPYNSSGTALTAITLGGSGNARTLTSAQWSSTYVKVVVTVTLLGYSDSITIVKVKDGAKGDTGNTGSAGKDAIVGFLTNESITLSADVNGTVSSFATATGTFEVYDGITKKTGTSVTYAMGTQTNCTVSIATTGVYTVSAMSSDTATATMTATYGGVTITKVLSLSKSRRGVTGANGNDAIVAVLSNEASTVPADSSGNVTSLTGASTIMYIFNGVLDDSANWTVTAGTPSGLTGGLSGKTYTVTGVTADAGYVDLTASRSGYASITKRFTVTKNKQGIAGTNGTNGTNGQNATTYWLVNSVPAIQKSATGTYTPATVTVTGKSQTGTGSPANYSGMFKISDSTDGTTFTVRYTSAGNEATTTYTPSANIKALKVQMYLAGGVTNLLDEQIIPIVSDGAKGDTGSAGKGITSIVEQYYLSTSSTTQTGGSWSTTVPAWSNGKYMWTRSVVTYTDSSTTTTSPVNVTGSAGSNGTNGADGVDGVGISSVDVEYYLSTSSTTQTGGTWSTTAPAWVDGRYMWTRTKTTYTNSTSTYSNPANVTGSKGATGQDGSDGKGVASATVTYQNHTNGTTAPTGTWSSTIPATVKGQYLWTRTVTAYTDSSSVTTYSVAYNATDGQNGSDGKGISSTAIAYQLHTNGTTAPTGTWVASPPTPVKGQYLWTRTIISYTDSSSSTSYSTSYYATDGQKGDKGDTGASALSVILLNENQSVVVTSSRTASPAQTVTIPFTAFLGSSQIACTATVGTLPSGVTLTSNTAGTTTTNGTIVLTVASGANLGGTTSAYDFGAIDITINANGVDVAKQFNWSKAIAGSTARTYFVEPDVSVIKKSESGVYTPTSLVFSSYYKDGTNSSKTAYARYWKIETTTDGSTWTQLETKTDATVTTYTVTIPANIVGIRATTYSSSALTSAHDTQSVMIVSDGTNGVDGVSVTSIVEEYYHSTSATTQTGGSWSTTVPTWADGKYVWTRAKTTFSDSSTSTTSPVNVTGSKGTNGTTYYTWVKYADNESGAGLSDSPSGKRYMGIATNKTSSTESTTASDYTWSPLYDNVVVGGRNLALDSNNGGNGWSSTGYNIIQGTLSGDWIVGETYTITIKGTVNTGQSFKVWRDTGSTALPNMSYDSDKDLWYGTFVCPATTQTVYDAFSVYNYPSASATSSDIEWIKIEKGNIATDWLPAPEDVQNQIDNKADSGVVETLTAEYNSALIRTSNDITGTVDSKITDAEGRITEAYKSEVKQTTDAFNISFTEQNGKIDGLNGDMAEVKSYFKFEADGLNIGKSDSPLNITISNSQIDFVDNGSVVAYVNGKMMYIDSLEVLTSLLVGNHKIEKYSSEITMIKYSG